jgi:hypothetical protein
VSKFGEFVPLMEERCTVFANAVCSHKDYFPATGPVIF